MYNLYVHICVLDVCVCYVCTTYLFVYKHLCDGIGIHRTLCVVKNNLWINILCLFLVRNGISLVVFCWLCYSGWPRSSQKPSSLCFSSCSRSTGSTDARICVWLVSDLICQVTTPAQHPSLVSVTVVNTMMKMQLEKKNNLFLFRVCSPSQKSTKARIQGRGCSWRLWKDTANWFVSRLTFSYIF